MAEFETPEEIRERWAKEGRHEGHIVCGGCGKSWPCHFESWISIGSSRCKACGADGEFSWEEGPFERATPLQPLRPQTMRDVGDFKRDVGESPSRGFTLLGDSPTFC